MSERVRVEFDEDDRVVLLDGRPGGHTNVDFDTDTGTHTFSLDGDADFTPRSRKRVVKNTSYENPLVLQFEKKATTAGGNG